MGTSAARRSFERVVTACTQRHSRVAAAAAVWSGVDASRHMMEDQTCTPLPFLRTCSIRKSLLVSCRWVNAHKDPQAVTPPRCRYKCTHSPSLCYGLPDFCGSKSAPRRNKKASGGFMNFFSPPLKYRVVSFLPVLFSPAWWGWSPKGTNPYCRTFSVFSLCLTSGYKHNHQDQPSLFFPTITISDLSPFIYYPFTVSRWGLVPPFGVETLKLESGSSLAQVHPRQLKTT